MFKTKKREAQNSKPKGELPMLHPNAGEIDIGATEIYVSVPPERDPEPVRAFPTFTHDLHRLADWLKAYWVETVAIAINRCLLESTVPDPGSTWIRGVLGECPILSERSR